jgi:hypothetical protein
VQIESLAIELAASTPLPGATRDKIKNPMLITARIVRVKLLLVTKLNKSGLLLEFLL